MGLRPTLPLLLLACLSCGEAPPAEPPAPVTRYRLFDRMDEARRVGSSESVPVHESTVTQFTFDEESQSPAAIWSASPRGRRLEWIDGEGTVEVAEEAGRSGAALRIGPGLARDFSRAVVLLPVEGRSRVTVDARVSIDGHPDSTALTSREAIRVYEHRGVAVEDPTIERNVEGGRARRRTLSRASRRLDPSGWDRVRAEAVTSIDARTLELHFLHRTEGEADVTTRFDDVVVTVTPIEESTYVDLLAERYRPRDGQEATTPWRLRVNQSSEVRDCTVVHEGEKLELPLVVPPTEYAPRLRFAVAAFPEARNEDGDGTRMTVEFRSGEDRFPIDVHEIDPKNERSDRRWHVRSADLSAFAGREGHLAFHVSDVDDEIDPLDALLLATPRVEPADDAPPVPNVLLIGVDTLRTDRLSAFGYTRDTTPNLAAVAEDSVLFSMARSPAPWTLPSFSSMLTSLYPSAHGAGRGGHDEWEAIDPTTVSVAEILARNGYETVGVVANGLISPRYGLDQGFESYYSEWAMESVGRHAPKVAEFVESHTSTPWLMFWHIMDPHLPYTTPEETRVAFTDEDYDGRFARSGRGGPAVPFQVLDPRPGRRWYAHEGPPPAPDLSEADERFVNDYYDAEIAETDAGIGLVLDALRNSGQYERTIIAFVADHGEGLGDHGHYHHGYTLFDDQVHVPMLLRIPGMGAGRTIERPVSTVDLVPTLLGALGLGVHDAMHGRDRLAPDAPAVDATFIEYPTYDSSAQKAWVEGSFKYLHDPLFQTEALYDFIADPGEKRNILDQHPDVVARARAALNDYRLEHLSAGRFYLRLRGEPGQRLQLRVATDDLFDANFVARPAVPEEAFDMPLDRKHLALDTVLEDGRLELRFWCRGQALRIEAELDGEPLTGLQIESNSMRETPTDFDRSDVPTARAEELGWPAVGSARLWLEAGASDALPVLNTPEEVERLKELGYAH